MLIQFITNCYSNSYKICKKKEEEKTSVIKEKLFRCFVTTIDHFPSSIINYISYVLPVIDLVILKCYCFLLVFYSTKDGIRNETKLMHRDNCKLSIYFQLKVFVFLQLAM